MKRVKRAGFSDKQIGIVTKKTEMEVRELRKKLGVLPSIKQIDTLRRRIPAETNYLISPITVRKMT